MEVSYDERRAMLYRDLERGDIVVGRINNIREYGFFLTLLCTAMGLKRDIEDLELSVGQRDAFINKSASIVQAVHRGSQADTMLNLLTVSAPPGKMPSY